MKRCRWYKGPSQHKNIIGVPSANNGILDEEFYRKGGWGKRERERERERERVRERERERDSDTDTDTFIGHFMYII